MRGVYIMWINCYAAIFPKKAVGLYLDGNQLDGRLSHRRFMNVVRLFCLIFDFFSLMDRMSSLLETRAWGFLLLQLYAFSGSKVGIILNGHELYHSNQLEIVSVQRDRL